MLERYELEIPSGVALCLDNSRHDAHQDWRIHEAVSGTLWKLRIDDLSRHIGLSRINRNNVLAFATNSKHKIKLQLRGKTRIAAVIKGTTVSGNAALTTLGNSLNVYFVHTYILSRHNIPHRLLVSGDDVVAIVPEDRAQEAIDVYWNYVSPDKSPRIHGFGW